LEVDRFEMEARSGMSIQPGERERSRFDVGPPAEPSPASGPSFGGAVRGHWRLIAGVVAGMTLLAIAYGVVRTPDYSAQTRLAVGGLNATTPSSLIGFSAASSSLAQTYSRSIQGDAVVQDVARELKTTPTEIRPQLSASPIPETPVFVVTATTNSQASAIDTSRLASEALVKQANRASDSTPNRLLDQYQRAEAQREAAERRLATAVGSTAVAQARGDLVGAKARADALRKRYSDSLEGGTVPLQIIQQPDAAASDRFSKLQLLIFAGIVGGFIIGLGVALFIENTRFPRFEESSLGRWELARRNRAQRARARRSRG
jgi:uncharacterized protein involved in exopolysaccharide biosynthesis